MLVLTAAGPALALVGAARAVRGGAVPLSRWLAAPMTAIGVGAIGALAGAWRTPGPGIAGGAPTMAASGALADALAPLTLALGGAAGGLLWGAAGAALASLGGVGPQARWRLGANQLAAALVALAGAALAILGQGPGGGEALELTGLVMAAGGALVAPAGLQDPEGQAARARPAALVAAAAAQGALAQLCAASALQVSALRGELVSQATISAEAWMAMPVGLGAPPPPAWLGAGAAAAALLLVVAGLASGRDARDRAAWLDLGRGAVTLLAAAALCAVAVAAAQGAREDLRSPPPASGGAR